MPVGLTGSPLARAVDDFVHELDEIESIFASCKGNRTVRGGPYVYTPSEDGCLVSLWDAWTRFLRSLVVLSASGTTVGLAGTVYFPAVARAENQVIADLNANRRGHKFRIIGTEPKWNDSDSLDDIMSFLGLPNATVITGAVGSSFVTLGTTVVDNPLEEIRICRNFVAHKSGATLGDVKAYARSPYIDLSTHLRQRRSGVETFSEWKDCLLVLAESAAQ
jgi:hypothetical protein